MTDEQIIEILIDAEGIANAVKGNLEPHKHDKRVTEAYQRAVTVKHNCRLAIVELEERQELREQSHA